MKISSREQNLLLFLLYLVVGLAFIMLIILPLQSSIQTRKITNANLTDQKELMVAQINNRVNLDSRLTQAIEKVSLEFNKIESMITPDVFELKLQPYLTSHPIDVLSWVVNEPSVASPQLPTYQNSGFEYKLKVLLDSYLRITDPNNTLPVTDAELIKTTLTVTFVSKYDDFLGLIDLISGWNSTVYVSSANRDVSTETSVITIDIYTISKP
jgi:hypothetical protein